MYKKKMIVLTLASLMTLSMPLIAEEAASEDSASAGTPESALAPPEAEAPASTASPSAGDDRLSAMQARWRERDARYEELKERAKEAGVMLPDEPPWRASGWAGMPDMSERMQRHPAMMAMTPEERMAMREERYREMQARAKERGIEMPDNPPWEARQSAMDEEWARHQAVIDAMTDEERAACHAMHRRHMGMMSRDMPERPMMRGPMGPGMMGPGAMGPGYGYGPNPYAPQNFWDPNQ